MVFFYDPITQEPCDETKYWTPFDQTQTCYRWVNTVLEDSETNEEIYIMLDHNVVENSTFSDYKARLKEVTDTWKNYEGEVDLIDEDLIFKLYGYEKKPEPDQSVRPKAILGHYSINNMYQIDGKISDSKGYWTKTDSGDHAFAVSTKGNNELVKKTETRGIRPYIKIKKSKLVTISPELDITPLLLNFARIIKYPWEYKKYGEKKTVFKQLQGFTVTNDKICFHASNGGDPENGVFYSYLTKDFITPFKIEYSNTGHGNGCAYNSKKDKVLLCGPDGYKKLFEYDGKTMTKEKEYDIKDGHPLFNGVGYDYNTNNYIGYAGHTLFYADPENIKSFISYDILMFETTQDVEYYEGNYYYTTFNGGVGTYQKYSFYEKGSNLVDVFDSKFDKDGKITKNFGRLKNRLYIGPLGELESISFRDHKVYFGFATQSVPKGNKYGYTFYEVDYKKFVDFVAEVAKRERGQPIS